MALDLVYSKKSAENKKKYRIWLENAMKEVERAYAELIQEPVE